MSYPAQASSVPKGWEIRPLKFSVQLRNEKIDAESTDLDYMGLEHIESWTGKRIEDESAASEGTATRFAKNDVLFGKLRPYLAKVYLAEQEGIATTEALVLTSEAVLEPAFLKYSLLSPAFIDAVAGASFGAKMPRANWETIGGLPILFPPKPEQQQIAAFLDWKTSQIDALIAKKQTLLQKLKEKRLAVITQAVTKGLNPDAPMRDSGIAWLGEVPSHWETLPIKHLLKAILDTEHKTCPYFEDGEYLVARTPNIRNGKLEVEGGRFTDAAGYKEWTARGKPLPGDILFTREAPAGEACIVPDEPPLCIGQRVVLFRTDAEKIDSRFAIYSLYGGAARTFIEMHSLGSTVAHFNMSEIAMIPMLVPPVAEQAKIADELDLATKRMDSMIDNAESAITRLTEYRSALITAATTGKIDVRGWQPQESSP